VPGPTGGFSRPDRPRLKKTKTREELWQALEPSFRVCEAFPPAGCSYYFKKSKTVLMARFGVVEKW